MATLSYTGRLAVETNSDGTIQQAARDRLHTLLDKAIAAYEGDQVTLRTAVVHFERNGQAVAGDDLPRIHIEMEKQGAIGDLGATEDAIAQAVVDIGMEPDKKTAADRISIQ